MSTSITEQAQQIVDGERQQAYGHPWDNFRRIAGVWNGLLLTKLNTPITPEEVALMMIGLKAAREVNCHKDDNMVDLHGYTSCLEMIIAKRAEQEASR